MAALTVVGKYMLPPFLSASFFSVQMNSHTTLLVFSFSARRHLGIHQPVMTSAHLLIVILWRFPMMCQLARAASAHLHGVKEDRFAPRTLHFSVSTDQAALGAPMTLFIGRCEWGRMCALTAATRQRVDNGANDIVIGHTLYSR